MEGFRRNVKWYVLGGLLIVNVFIWYAIFENVRGGVLAVAFLDVGQGDAVFIEAPNGKQVLIDGGGGKQVLRKLSSVMSFYDRSIDVVIATHPDKDHIGGLPSVVERHDVETILRSGAVNDTGVYASLNDLIKKRGVTEILARRGMVIALDTDVFLTILFPDRDVSSVDPNAASVIAKLVYGETEFLLTGDAPKSIEQYLLALDGKDLESDVLKVGHHGSKTSSAVAFVGFVNPDYSIISAGCGNRYGHPHTEVLETLKQFETKVLGTCEEGTIVFESDGTTLWQR